MVAQQNDPVYNYTYLTGSHGSCSGWTSIPTHSLTHSLRLTNAQTHERSDALTNRSTHLTNARTHGRTDARTHGRTDARTHGRTDALTH